MYLGVYFKLFFFIGLDLSPTKLRNIQCQCLPGG